MRPTVTMFVVFVIIAISFIASPNHAFSSRLSSHSLQRVVPFARVSSFSRHMILRASSSSDGDDQRLVVTSTPETTKATTVPAPTSFGDSVKKFLKGNWLVIGEVLVILIANKWPAFGASGGPLRPEFFISKCGVFTIFFINGLALSIQSSPQEMQSATKTNAIIQLFNFAFIPLMAKLLSPYYPHAAFRDGLLALSVLPCTINICVAQTLAAGGNMGTAIFNAIFANVLGVFLTPLLAVVVMGTGKGVSLLGTLQKLGWVVIFPLALGQICRRTPIGKFADQISGYSRTLSSCLLLAIVYNVFSDTFMSGIGVGGSALATLLFAMPVVYLALSGLFWRLSMWLLPGLDVPTRAAAMFCSAQKTLAFGIPFIKTAFGGRADLAYILAPLLIYAPSQLLLGSVLLVPSMSKKIKDAQSFADGGGI